MSGGPTGPVLVEVTRRAGGREVVESAHHGHLVVVAPDGRVHALGDPDALVLPRSAVKPLQATACLELLGDVAAELTSEELAVAWASHRGEARHLAAVRRLLARSSTDPRDLTCPPGWPEAATRWPPVAPDEPPSRLRFNCSGKHAMFALAGRTLGLSGAALVDPEAPLQQHVLATLDAALGGVRDLAVDGCGAPAVRAPLVGVARAFAAVAATDRFRLVRDAGLRHPGLVEGTGRAATALLRRGVVAKGGAEGVMAAGWVDGDGAWGLATKCADGAARGAATAAVAVLEAVGAVAAPAWRAPAPGGGGVPVGSVRATGAVVGLLG